VEQLDTILSACSHPKVTRALFSATLGQGVEEMARSLLRDPGMTLISMCFQSEFYVFV